MKKIALLMALVMVVGCLWACGEDPNQKAKDTLDGIFNNANPGNIANGNNGGAEDPTATTEAHKFEEKILEEPDCYSAGSRLMTCSDCGLEVTEEIPALGHDITDASCTEPGVCSRCGEMSPALGHIDQNGVCGNCGVDMSEVSNVIPTVPNVVEEEEFEEPEESVEATEAAAN